MNHIQLNRITDVLVYSFSCTEDENEFNMSAQRIQGTDSVHSQHNFVAESYETTTDGKQSSESTALSDAMSYESFIRAENSSSKSTDSTDSCNKAFEMFLGVPISFDGFR